MLLLGGAAPWTVGVLLGFGALVHYSSTPGDPAAPPNRWPADTEVVRRPDRYTLLMFLHPQCPCSQASLEELSRILGRANDLPDTHILLVRPPGAGASWENTSLSSAARAVPAVCVNIDGGGVEARRFNVATSGTTLLYDPGGRLLFHGGITGARGHAGDNAGASAVTAALLTGRADPASTDVFGCRLFDARIMDHPEASPCHQ